MKNGCLRRFRQLMKVYDNVSGKWRWQERLLLAPAAGSPLTNFLPPTSIVASWATGPRCLHVWPCMLAQRPDELFNVRLPETLDSLMGRKEAFHHRAAARLGAVETRCALNAEVCGRTSLLTQVWSRVADNLYFSINKWLHFNIRCTINEEFKCNLWVLTLLLTDNALIICKL